ncbi:AAA family ATPase [Paenibacillus apiarius]|uniref:MoxR family ATPase n=1 Tax=Paenibacillus apiarius TaxID=46240 RepID=A0ABT4E326_9BACL|nr:MoxR family ATPase [Paenibacillus apiarius]MCY9515151.1 MoxR family ATPase [Paenibacillus apiarius]MCY9522748.1 MoxR family ATPase [Paenibacillus apiarius]MCY9552968.1 MoxR family ATPase [Paenibacillus apiarius]MCY9557615.1 MoxR family ATPase [Paenibacillus apiarius]MCY9681854.1 MoxR family ATPase [Paenibacillus apiarius]
MSNNMNSSADGLAARDHDVWLAAFAERGWTSFMERLEQVVVGKREVVRLAGLAMLSGGHILLEDVPGVGKTLLARALAQVAGGSFRRIQMTPDMMPADITGSMMWEPGAGGLRYSEGALHANVVLADELNRAPARTQSALLEAMEEGTVTVDGTTRALPQPFLVVATQNPLAFEGTYRMPEAEMDRFAMRLSLGYPAAEQEADMLLRQQAGTPLRRLNPLWSPEEWRLLIERVRQVHLDVVLCRYMADLAAATRRHPALRLGVSPRGTLALMRTAQAHAWVEGRTYAVPEDVQAVAMPVLTHRLLLQREAALSGVTEEEVLAEVLLQTAVPGFPGGAQGAGRPAKPVRQQDERGRASFRESGNASRTRPAPGAAVRNASSRIWFGGLFR